MDKQQEKSQEEIRQREIIRRLDRLESRIAELHLFVKNQVKVNLSTDSELLKRVLTSQKRQQ